MSSLLSNFGKYFFLGGLCRVDWGPRTKQHVPTKGKVNTLRLLARMSWSIKGWPSRLLGVSSRALRRLFSLCAVGVGRKLSKVQQD